MWSVIEDKHPDWSLNIVGEGEESSNLKQIAKREGLKRVNFIGFTNNPKQYYDRASIVCMTSTYEGWGMVLMEAQANRCAVMAFDCSAGVREILSPSWGNGVLIKPFDIDAYAKALSRLITDTDLREKIVMNGSESVKRFSLENTLQQWNSVFNELSIEE